MDEEGIILDEFHYHEALDRTSMLCDILQDQLMTHPVFQTEENLKKLLEFTIISLYDVYSNVGAIMVEKFHERNSI
jgi:hypothetical protein